MENLYKEILEFWFPNNKEYCSFWFNSNIKLDTLIKEKYSKYLLFLESSNVLSSNFKNKYNNSEKLLADIIVLDQFSRNIYRGTKYILKNDDKAKELAKYFIDQKYYSNYNFNRIIFCLMPFRHSENIEDQQFVLNFLKMYECNSLIFKKFKSASERSFNEIKKNGCFLKRKSLK